MEEKATEANRPTSYQVDDLIVDVGQQRVTRAGTDIPLPQLSFELLITLARAAPDVVSFDDLIDRVWPGLVITPETISQRVKLVREALGDDPHAPRYIGSVRGRGYRMVAAVKPLTSRDRSFELIADVRQQIVENQSKEAAIAPRTLPSGAPQSPPAPPAEFATLVPPRDQRISRALTALLAVLALSLGYFLVNELRLSRSVTVKPAATEARTVAPENSIAVLPFVDMSERKDQEYFADGMADELIDRLARAPGLYVPARTSSFYFKGKQTTVDEIARALRVSHLLEGSVRKSGNVVRVTVQLVRADNGYHLWSETYDRKLDDIFVVQDDITSAVATALNVRLLPGTTHGTPPSRNAEAFELYLKARSSADLDQAADYLHQALKKDPDFALAWSALCQVRLRQHFSEASSRAERATEARYAAARALALNPGLVEVHTAAGAVRRDLDWDWNGAEVEFRRAVDLDPRSSAALGAAASIPWFLGRYDEALDLYQRAIAQDPLDAAAYANVGRMFMYAGRMPEAVTALRHSLTLRPDAGALHWHLAMTLLFLGDRDAARAELEKEPNSGLQTLGNAILYHEQGRTSESDSAMADAAAQMADCCRFLVATGYAYRGEVDLAFEWLDRAYREHEDALERIKGHPLLRNLQSDARYWVLLRQMRLAD
jgi:TolB-like protein/DNA-binding winged helix-turn-helix (wHTH) protein/Tfp pilus assembly protein PilF